MSDRTAALCNMSFQYQIHCNEDVNQALLREHLESEDFLDTIRPVLLYDDEREVGTHVFNIESITMDDDGHIAGTAQLTEEGEQQFGPQLTEYANPVLQIGLTFDALNWYYEEPDEDEVLDQTALDDVDDDETVSEYTNFQCYVIGFAVGSDFHDLECLHAESVD